MGKPVVSVDYVVSPEWELASADDGIHSQYYVGSAGVFDDYTINITCKRNSESYIFNMLLPCIILLVITMFSFYLPPESGERITVVSTNLLTIAIFLMTTSSVLPHNSDSIAVISIFYIALMCESAFSLFMSYCILFVYHQSESNFPNKIPTWIHVIFLQMIAKKLGYYSKGTKMNKEKKVRRKTRLITPAVKVKDCSRKHGVYGGLQMICEDHQKPMYNKPPGLRMAEIKSSLQINLEKPKAWKKCLQVAKRFNSFNLRIDKEDYNYDSKLPNEELNKILGKIHLINLLVNTQRQRKLLRNDWKILGAILDRLFLGIFLTMVSGTIVGILTPAIMRNIDA